MKTLARMIAVSVASFLLAGLAEAEPVVLDDFAEPSRWEVIRTEGVELDLTVVPGVEGEALRLSYDFTKGAGFCIIRRAFDVPLPANYRFDLFARGRGPANDLEFKLVSPSGDDVWWNNRRGFEPPAEWTELRNRRRHFEFAWGPSGGTPMERVWAIEFAIASKEGGRGFIELDELTFEALPEVDPRPVGGVVRIGGDAVGARRIGAVDERGVIPWPAGGDRVGGADWIEIGFDHGVEFGAIEIEWDSHRPMGEYDIAASDDGESWRVLRRVDHGRGGTHAFFLPESEARAVRLVSREGFGERRPVRVRLSAIDESPDANAFWSARARAERRGLFPPYFLGERAAWTVVGLPGDDNEALVSEYGAIESFKAGGTIEPFLFVGGDAEWKRDGRLVTWADAEVTRSLEEGYLPIPTVSWRAGDVGLEITAVATGGGGDAGEGRDAGDARLLVRYRVRNAGEAAREVGLELAARPFQVQPSYQWLNVLGGETDASVLLPEAEGGGAATAAVTDTLGLIADPDGPFTSAAARRWTIEPGGTREVVLEVPLRDGARAAWGEAAEFERVLSRERARWAGLLEEPGLTLPEEAGELVRQFRTAIGHMLINADGPAIQPGSRTYERSWIRDGSVTSLALIHAGHEAEARAFIEWYAGYQFESGKVPCVVDRRGPDPVDEHDSTGQFIYALRNAAIATGDAAEEEALLREHYENVTRGVAYMESLRAQRLTGEYIMSVDPIERACIGLMPESISHEGYSAKPMHSYWDDFWALRGYEDAAAIARRLGEEADAARFAKIAADFRDDLYNSIRLAADHHGIDYVPGCVELGDFDATSTAIAVFLGERGRAPEPLLTNTFERYWRFFVDRRDGVEAWDGMTPYELRLVGAFVRMGWSERAHEMLDWLMTLRSPGGWNQWGEIAYADPSRGRFVGDMPHTWVASGYVLSIVAMLAYEEGDRLVLAGGVPMAWIESDGAVGAEGLYTHWGPVSYTLRATAEGARLEMLETPAAPGGVFVRVPAGYRVLGGAAGGGLVRVDGDVVSFERAE